MLKLQLKNKPGSAIWLVKSDTTVGSDAQCDFVVQSKAVADTHIVLKVNHDQVELEDKGHGKTTFVNEIPVGEYGPLKHLDCIKIGDTELEIIDPKQAAAAANAASHQGPKTWSLKANGDWLAGKSYEIDGHSVLGRDAQCDITIAGTYLSRRHAELTPSPEGLVITDLESANGTYLNGEKVSQAVAKPGDELRFDTLIFTVDGPDIAAGEAFEEEEDDSNKTIMRPIPAIKPKAPAQPQTTESIESDLQAEKRWKTKPTSVGNRPGEEPVEAKSTKGVWIFSGIMLIAALGVLGFLLVM